MGFQFFYFVVIVVVLVGGGGLMGIVVGDVVGVYDLVVVVYGNMGMYKSVFMFFLFMFQIVVFNFDFLRFYVFGQVSFFFFDFFLREE